MKKQYALFANIKKTRKNLGLSQDDIAKRLRVSEKTISAYETGRAIPPLPTLERLATILCVSVTDLMGSNEKAVVQNDYDRIKALEERLSNVEQILLKLLNKK